ncbi:toll-like receptor 7 [Neocloeon triangulifer]|uniref:toll-like receptor 7 n=1 Tax=Neocloeon triangulifer TaxID=2078957 RepID=UPI00286F5714|nr:toll-like receptor 7 [Neocloeon triangulifer]
MAKMNFVSALGLLLGVVLFCAPRALGFKYEAPDFCSWSLENNETSRVGVWCKVRTLAGELAANRTNNAAGAVSSLAGLQTDGTSRLRVECSEVLFFESTLSPGLLSRLNQLEDLEIEHCKLGQLHDGVFRGLSNLKKLSVRTHNSDWSSARQLEVTDASFDGLKELQTLDLAHNNMRDVPTNVFCHLPNLNVLNLSNNALQHLDPTLLGGTSADSVLSDEPADKSSESRAAGESCEVDVIALDVSWNNLTDLPSVINSPRRRRLQQLLVQNNQLTALRASSLTGLASLRVLNASSNLLVDLPAVPLRETCRELREVNLRGNALHDLGDTFQRLEQLLVLDVAKNRLVNLGSSLAGLIRLIVLDLSGNALIRLEALAFKDLYSLQILDLRDNAIASVADDAFLPLYNLHTLSLAGNQLTRIGPSLLNGLFVLNKLTLSLNLLTEIDPRAFRNCSDLKELDLSGNELSEVPAALTELPFLRTLDLGENRITGFTNGSFKNMHQLTGLRLIDNNIGNITVGMLWDLVGLQVLSLAKNKILHVERGAFDRNERLEAIRLDANYLTDVNGVFTALPSLLWLNLSDNHLVWFDYAFVPPSLQWLDIHSNFIEKLGNYYEITDGFHLRTIDVSHNKLTELSSLSIPNSVEIFFTNNNKIKKVASGTFTAKQNLTRVDLYANDLEYLDLSSLQISHPSRIEVTITDDDEFPELQPSRPLPEFYLGGNPFKCDCTMEWLQRVNNMTHNDHLRGRYPRVMDLDDVVCRMTHSRNMPLSESTTMAPVHIPVLEARPSNFLCRYETHCFALCHCCDFDACDCEMTCPTNCTCYHDQSWRANVVDCSSSNHVTLPSSIPMDATEVYLDGNNLRELRNHAFIGRKNMQILYVNNSNVETIQNRTFNGLNSLQILYLHENKIKVLRGYEFENLMHLRELYLQHNRLTHIGNATFLPLRALQLLRLDGNRLASFPVWQLKMNPYVTEMYLNTNPWACRCRFVAALSEWLQEDKRQIIDGGAAKCLENFNNEEICNHEEDEDDVMSTAVLGTLPRLFMNDYLPTVIGTLFVVLLVIVLAILAFAYRDNVRLWVFARYGIRLFHKTSSAAAGVSAATATLAAVKREDKDKLYDAYMCYSPKDEEELVQCITSGLENGNPRYSLCLHYRDLPSIAGSRDTAICEASDASRRVILVVSRNFLQTEWPRREFRAALHESLHGRTFKLIIIEEAGGLPPEVERDPDLRPYLKTARRIRWGDKRFWERLKYAMPESKSRDNLHMYRQNINYTLDARGHHQPLQNHHIHHHHAGTMPGKRKQFNAAPLNNHPLFNNMKLDESNNVVVGPTPSPRLLHPASQNRPPYSTGSISPRSSEHIYSSIDSDYSTMERANLPPNVQRVLQQQHQPPPAGVWRTAANTTVVDQGGVQAYLV